MVFDPGGSNLSQALRLHYAIAAGASQTSISYIATVFAYSGGAARLIVSFAVRPRMSQLGQTEKNSL
jgi:hypothetical protein